MLIITKESVQQLKEKLEHSGDVGQCREELEKMLEIKGCLLWRADTGCACAGWQLPAHLFWEMQQLEAALVALERGDSAKAASLLDDYISQL
jgi:hypothetical protein